MALKSYSMQQASQTARIGTAHVVNYLHTQRTTVAVVNVEDDETYRTQDIDLIWKREFNGVCKNVCVEVKVDTYFHTGNYFFETFSNVEKNTPGCFLYSQADYFFYYFLNAELHLIELQPVRAWFKDNIDRFAAKRTRTPVGQGFYHTEGRLVNCHELKKALPKHVNIIPFSDNWLPTTNTA